jgi:hypothetical protein
MFNLEEAEKLLPQLEGWLRAAIENKKKISEIETEYTEMVRLLSTSGGRVLDIAHWIQRKQEEERSSESLRNAAHQIEESGCLVKDLEIGLIDFPCELDGREVYLCWKLGEPSIEFWHNTEEGFAGRKPIDGRFTDPFKRLRPM